MLVTCMGIIDRWKLNTFPKSKTWEENRSNADVNSVLMIQ
jgi:hypothetical protein